jgi:hypothetical protein
MLGHPDDIGAKYGDTDHQHPVKGYLPQLRERNEHNGD